MAHLNYGTTVKILQRHVVQKQLHWLTLALVEWYLTIHDGTVAIVSKSISE